MSKYIKILFSILFCTNLNASDYFWVGGQSKWSQFSNHWATTSGGNIFHSSVPTASDNVFFDANSTTYLDTVFIDVPASCNNLTLDEGARVIQNNVLTITGIFNLLRGNFSCNTNTLNINKFDSNNSFIRTFDITNSTVNITGYDTVWTVYSILFDFIQTGSTVNINYSGNNPV